MQKSRLVFLRFCLYFFLKLSKDFEASFIRLLDKLTNGSRIEVNETGKTYVTQASAFMNGQAFVIR